MAYARVYATLTVKGKRKFFFGAIVWWRYFSANTAFMKNYIITLCISLTATLFLQAQIPHFLSSPALSPDGAMVIFSYESDLWQVPSSGGQAVRITAMGGYESNPRISPDGKWLAFNSNQKGNNDIYLMPMAGGEIRQLTFNTNDDVPDSWSWDSKHIYFTSSRDSRQAGYKVSIEGGTPKRVLGDFYFSYDHNLWEHPNNGEIFFTDSWESRSQAYRKRYKGPFAPDIQSYDLKTGSFKRYTTYEGKDFSHSIDNAGQVYFASDEANGEYNLYTLESGKKKALTKFETSIKSPMVNANGGKIVFEKDYQLWLYDVAKANASLININLSRNYTLPTSQDFTIADNPIAAYDVSPDGKKLAFISRGELFVSDIEGKFVKQLERGNAERVSEVKWLSDNKTLMFLQTLGGYTNLFTMTADGSSPIKNITSDLANGRFLTLNSNRTQAAYISGRGEVKLADTKTLTVKTILKDEIWGNRGSAPLFSPNDEYLVFNVYRDFETDIMVYNLKTNKAVNLTNSGVTEADPMWSPDGKYLYFVSNPIKPSYPTGFGGSAKIYRVALNKFDDPYRMDKYDELFKTPAKDSTKKKDSTISITIDMANFLDRMETVGPFFGSQALVAVIQKGDKQTVLYNSNHDEGRGALWKTVYEPFEAPKTEKVQGGESGGGSMVTADNKYYLLTRTGIAKFNPDANKIDPIKINTHFQRNLAGEFAQIFEEAWAQMEENFYDDSFRGLDWTAIRKRYAAHLPFVNNRQDLRILMNDMLGELNSSHTGFSSFGDEEKAPFTSLNAETGIVFENDQPFTVKEVLRDGPTDKESITIKPGDVLVKVNDITVDASKNRNSYFAMPARAEELKLTFKNASGSYDVNVHPISSQQTLLYDKWIYNNQQKVDKATNNKVAYVHMKNMGGGELNVFLRDMARDFYKKDALIFDLRYNTGGNVHDEVLRFLSQKEYLQWKYRNGSKTGQSNFAPADKPIVLLINEQSLSDAEMTAAGFKALKLGTVVGNETYRWIIFTTGTGFVDGSFVRLPSWGCYTLDGKDLEFSGVQPDVKVLNSFEDKMKGRDPQLDKAIDIILQQMK